MTIEGKSYLASDLAAELNVARSTINDWLTRYADYLESEARGKRKVYSARSLNVLKTIAELRDGGAGSFEIEQQLAARYGVRPEVAPPAPEPRASDSAASAEKKPESSEASTETLPMARPAFEEMSSRISGEFGRLADKIGELEVQRRSFARKMWRILGLTAAAILLLLALLSAAAYRLYGGLDRRGAETGRSVAALTEGNSRLELLQRENASRARAAEEQSRKQLEQLAGLLDRSRQDFQANLARLNRELDRQRKEYEAQLVRLEKNAATREEAEKLRLKTEFARIQEQKLRELTAQYEKKLQAHAADATLRQENARLRQELKAGQTEAERRNRELEDLKRRLPGEKTIPAATAPEVKP